MKYCFVNYSFAGSADSFAVEGRRPIGGGEIYLLDLCRLLQRHGHETAVVQGGKCSERFEMEGTDVVQVKSKGRYYFNLDWKKGVPKDASRVHLHDANHAFPLASAQNTATFHGASWDVPYAGRNPAAYARWRARNEFFEFLIRYAVRHCKKIVSVDTVLKRYVERKMPLLGEKIQVIPNYVDPRIFKPVKTKRRGKKVILMPRNLTRNRGIDIMLDAFNLLARNDAELWVAGTGPLQAMVEAAERKNPLIKFLGHKDHYADLPGLYNRADVVVVPSRGVEGTSLAVLEAMACGKPVVASRVGGIPDIISDGKDGILCAPTPAQFAQNVSALLNDDALAGRIGKAAVKRAADFSLSRWNKSWLDFLEA